VSTAGIDEQALRRLRGEPLGDGVTPLPPGEGSLSVDEVSARGWNALDGDVLMPAAMLKESALARNLAEMAEFCGRHGVSLAPHGKTTMAPQLFQRQLQAGAWAMTAAGCSLVQMFDAPTMT
jgi:D-serine dehydratase